MTKSRSPESQASQTQTPQAQSLQTQAQSQDPMAEQPVLDGTGLAPGEAPTASEIWWRTFTLTSREAAAGGPVDFSNAGEEDPGSGLELLVSQENRRKKAR